jgi:hypothetical protein
MPLYLIPLVVLIVVLAALGLLLLFTPVVVLIDSCRRDVKVRWSFLLSYASPLPGTKGGHRLSVAGIPVPLSTPKPKAPRKEKEEPGPDRTEARRLRRRKTRRFMWNCLLDGDIRSALMRRFRRLPTDLWDAVEINRWHSDVSLPDPALNGMLYGALAAVNVGPRTRLQCNFIGRNEVRTELRLYPHRVVKAFLLLFLQLPYRAVFKQWRAS